MSLLYTLSGPLDIIKAHSILWCIYCIILHMVLFQSFSIFITLSLWHTFYEKVKCASKMEVQTGSAFVSVESVFFNSSSVTFYVHHFTPRKLFLKRVLCTVLNLFYTFALSKGFVKEAWQSDMQCNLCHNQQ